MASPVSFQDNASFRPSKPSSVCRPQRWYDSDASLKQLVSLLRLASQEQRQQVIRTFQFPESSGQPLAKATPQQRWYDRDRSVGTWLEQLQALPEDTRNRLADSILKRWDGSSESLSL
jgi:hypothetical protein